MILISIDIDITDTDIIRHPGSSLVCRLIKHAMEVEGFAVWPVNSPHWRSSGV